MEIIPEGRHFRLVQESELPEILVYLERFLPESLKVISILVYLVFIFYFQLFAFLLLIMESCFFLLIIKKLKFNFFASESARTGVCVCVWQITF